MRVSREFHIARSYNAKTACNGGVAARIEINNNAHGGYPACLLY